MAKQAVDGQRVNAFRVDPHSVIVVGVDKKDVYKKTHPMYDPRVERPLDEDKLQGYVKYGPIKPIIVIKEGDDIIVDDGRRRTLYTRAANEIRLKQGLEPWQLRVMTPEKISMETAYDYSIMLNEAREEDDVVTKVEKLERWIQINGPIEGTNVEKACAVFACSRVTLKRYEANIGLHRDVKALVRDKKLSHVAAASLAALPYERQPEKAKELLNKGVTRIEDVQAEVKHEKEQERAARNGAAPVERTAPEKTITRTQWKKWLDHAEAAGVKTDTIHGVKLALGLLYPGAVKGAKAAFREAGIDLD